MLSPYVIRSVVLRAGFVFERNRRVWAVAVSGTISQPAVCVFLPLVVRVKEKETVIQGKD